jgi:hypothetical protein
MWTEKPGFTKVWLAAYKQADQERENWTFSTYIPAEDAPF